jgi:hypothetical protein
MYQTAMLPAAKRETMRLLEEIETLEHRLHAMGEDGDCAYERAMSTLYRVLVEERKQQLTQLALAAPA